MPKFFLSFLLKLLVLALLLCAIHYYIFHIFFSEMTLYFPLWAIYVFNVCLVLAVFSYLYFKVGNKNNKGYYNFLGLTLAKMMLAIVFLLPLFFNKSAHPEVEVINFFIPYFLFLIFEIYHLNVFFSQAETK